MNTLDEKQKIALQNAIDNEISVIAGLAGAGKSHVAKVISDELATQGWIVSRVAPTGKAAIRILGQTIHTWLGPEVEEDKWGNVKLLGFLKQTFEPKECLIVDEASMIPDELWGEIVKCFNASNGEKKIIFVGDVGQLEPIGDGTPYLNTINSGLVPTVLLTQIHRNEAGNDIVDFAHFVRNGEGGKPEYNNVHGSTRAAAIKGAFEDLENTQIISCMRKGPNGTLAMNKEIQDMFKFEKAAVQCTSWDNDKKGWTRNGTTIYIGDKVVVTRNNFPLNLTNGTVGVVQRITMQRTFNAKYRLWEDVTGLEIKRDYDGELLFVPIVFAQKSMDLAYCLTVHKFQGSETDNVYFMRTRDQEFMWRNKKLLYTAVTRAKKELHIIF